MAPKRLEECVSRDELHEVIESLREIREEQIKQGKLLAQYQGAVKTLVAIGATITTIIGGIAAYLR